jgi:hypothetical protein
MTTTAIDAAFFFKERLRDELAAFTAQAIDALVAAVVTAGGTEYAALMGIARECDCAGNGGAGKDGEPPDG